MEIPPLSVFTQRGLRQVGRAQASLLRQYRLSANLPGSRARSGWCWKAGLSTYQFPRRPKVVGWAERFGAGLRCAAGRA